MSGCPGATSASVRAIAIAVSGSFDGILMIASLRVIALRMIVTAETSPPLPAGTCSARAPNARIRSSRPSASVRRDPALEVVDADARLGDLVHVLAPEHVGQADVAVAQDRGRVVRRREAGLVGLLDVAVLVDVERAAELGEHVGDLGERQRLEVGERHRARERQAVDVLARVGRAERAARAAPAELDPVVLDQLAAEEERNAKCRSSLDPLHEAQRLGLHLLGGRAADPVVLDALLLAVAHDLVVRCARSRGRSGTACSSRS